ncbi:MAG: SpoIIIAC/SpoIIIAD family protein [Lachnospiraceae bacterium]|nr:SpoIIIAC/SpoIIIAD family protein [Lachnospiraceae bacterium]MDD3797420.1 SpoIIIAC/SpoIIIAD family protein [Lachnospiraceae bacterium]
MTMLKIGCLGISSVLCCLLMKEMKSPFSTLISVGACILIAYFGLCKLEFVIGMIQSIEQYITLKTAWFEILLKITGITYLADFSSNLCKDAGYSAIAGQIEIFGKLSVLAISSPVILALIETIHAFLQ